MRRCHKQPGTDFWDKAWRYTCKPCPYIVHELRKASDANIPHLRQSSPRLVGPAIPLMLPFSAHKSAAGLSGPSGVTGEAVLAHDFPRPTRFILRCTFALWTHSFYTVVKRQWIIDDKRRRSWARAWPMKSAACQRAHELGQWPGTGRMIQRSLGRTTSLDFSTKN